MRRVLAWAVALQLGCAAVAMIALSGGGPAGPADLGPFGAPARGALTGADGPILEDGSHGEGPEERSGVGGGVGGGRRGHSNAASAVAGEADDGTAAPAEAAGRPGRSTRGISFRPPVDFATGATPSSAAFNKASGEQLLIQPRHLTLSDSVVTGDFDRDGDTDVVQTNVLAGTLSIFSGDGQGGFGPAVLHPVGVNPNFVASGDLDGDRKLDLVVADTGNNGVSILRGDGEGGFVEIGFLSVRDARNVAIGRIDGDDIPDLAVAAVGPVCPRDSAKECADAESDGGVHTFLGLGAGLFRPGEVVELAHSSPARRVGANFVALHDFNGDGLGDLAVTVGTSMTAFDRREGSTGTTGDDLLTFLNRGGTELFAATPDHPPIRVGGTPEAVAVGDWDGDSDADLAVLEAQSGSITSLVGDGRGGFRVTAHERSVGAVPRSLAAGDFDGDGAPDLVTASFAASTVSVLRGIGNGTFEPAVDHWAGNAPTSVAVGHFDGDTRLDVVVGRLRTDQLSLLTNDGPQRGDGVVVHRDVPYGSPTHADDADPFPTKHTLDVYVPPAGTAPFGASGSGSGGAYPVVFFAHGGRLITNNKSYNSYLLRSLSAQGIVAVSTNYRLGIGLAPEQVQDVAQAFRWTRDNIGSGAYRGDPDNIVAFGYSAGALLMNRLATDPEWGDEQRHIRALVLAGTDQNTPGTATRIPESLLLSGDEGLEAVFRFPAACEAYAAESNRRGTKSTHVHVPGRDHFTLVAELARAGDPGRVALDAFLLDHLRR